MTELQSSDFRIRKAGIWDIDDLEEIEKRCFSFGRFSRSVILGFLRHPFSSTLVVEKEGIVGSAILLFHTRTAEIATIAVLPEERGKGLASLMMTETEKLSRRRGISKISLHVAVENSSAIHLYEKHGYNITEKIGDYYGAGRDAFYMEKSLNGTV